MKHISRTMDFKTIHAATVFVNVDIDTTVRENQVVFVLRLKMKISIKNIDIYYIYKNNTMLVLAGPRDAFWETWQWKSFAVFMINRELQEISQRHSHFVYMQSMICVFCLAVSTSNVEFLFLSMKNRVEWDITYTWMHHSADSVVTF